MYQEPCCIDRALPVLMKFQTVCVWQTNGDVTFEKIVRAVSSLAGNTLTLRMAVPEIDIPMLRVIRWMYQRGWLRGVDILTQKDQSELIGNELAGLPAVRAVSHQRVGEGLLALHGERGHVFVQGWLGSTVTRTHRQYASYFGNNPAIVDMFVDSYNSLFRLAQTNARRRQAKKETEK